VTDRHRDSLSLPLTPLAPLPPPRFPHNPLTLILHYVFESHFKNGCILQPPFLA
jgi:hypothetical protein